MKNITDLKGKELAKFKQAILAIERKKGKDYAPSAAEIQKELEH